MFTRVMTGTLLMMVLLSLGATSHARNYDPESGRFTSRDPIGIQESTIGPSKSSGLDERSIARGMTSPDSHIAPSPRPDGPGLYQYVASRPVVSTDPYGQGSWHWRVHNLGQRAPVESPNPDGTIGVEYGGTRVAQWDVTPRVTGGFLGSGFGGCCSLDCDGTAVVEKWWSTPESVTHEVGHAMIYYDNFMNGIAAEAAQYTLISGMSCRKARCYESLIEIRDLQWRWNAEYENWDYELKSYPPGRYPVVERLREDAYWEMREYKKRAFRKSLKCDGIR